jgi:transcriptional regulator with XRE-family HTH domain
MGRKKRRSPARLAEKLKRIRAELGLSQSGMVRRLGFEEELTKSEISDFEHGKYEPNLLVLIAYSEAANVFVDVLIKDSLDLPKKIPAPKKSGGVPQS